MGPELCAIQAPMPATQACIGMPASSERVRSCSDLFKAAPRAWQRTSDVVKTHIQLAQLQHSNRAKRQV